MARPTGRADFFLRLFYFLLRVLTKGRNKTPNGTRLLGAFGPPFPLVAKEGTVMVFSTAAPSSVIATTGRQVPAAPEREKMDAVSRLSSEAAELRGGVTDVSQSSSSSRLCA